MDWAESMQREAEDIHKYIEESDNSSLLSGLMGSDNCDMEVLFGGAPASFSGFNSLMDELEDFYPTNGSLYENAEETNQQTDKLKFCNTKSPMQEPGYTILTIREKKTGKKRQIRVRSNKGVGMRTNIRAKYNRHKSSRRNTILTAMKMSKSNMLHSSSRIYQPRHRPMSESREREDSVWEECRESLNYLQQLAEDSYNMAHKAASVLKQPLNHELELNSSGDIQLKDDMFYDDTYDGGRSSSTEELPSEDHKLYSDDPWSIYGDLDWVDPSRKQLFNQNSWYNY